VGKLANPENGGVRRYPQAGGHQHAKRFDDPKCLTTYSRKGGAGAAPPVHVVQVFPSGLRAAFTSQ
jgi:hypothetical protein